MGDFYYRPFVISEILVGDGIITLSGTINDEYFSVSVVHTDKNVKMLEKLLGKDYSNVSNTKLDNPVEITTIWSVWIVPDNRPDDFTGFQDNEGEKYILMPVYF